MKRQMFSAMQWKEIKRKLGKGKEKIKDVKAYNRLLALHMRGLGKTNMEIKEVVGFSAQYITELVRKYMEKGIDAIITDKRTSNNRRMSFDEETLFLEQFREEAESGLIITVQKILSEFEEVSGKKSNTSTIYKLLKRHGWRKVKPRPCHPNGATDEEKDASKKLTFYGNKSCWKNIQ